MCYGSAEGTKYMLEKYGHVVDVNAVTRYEGSVIECSMFFDPSQPHLDVLEILLEHEEIDVTS